MIQRLPGGGLATGIGSLTAERDEEAAELLWDGYMDGIRRRATMRVRPVLGHGRPAASHASPGGDAHYAALAALLRDADEHRSGALAAGMFLLAHAERNA